MDMKMLSEEIVRLVCEKGKGLSTNDAIIAIRQAEALFYEKTKIVDGMLALTEE